jgi:acetyl-CoA carboxylase carboxyltransferase component
MRSLGGPEVHGERSGCAHFVVDATMTAAFALTRDLLSYLPSSSVLAPPEVAPEPPRPSTCRRRARRRPQPYDVRDVIRGVVDGGRFLEVQERLGPQPRHRVLAHRRGDRRDRRQPGQVAGRVPRPPASEKGARFVRFCDAFGIPLVVLVDVPRVPARDRPGVRRRDPQGREATPRLRVRDRPARHVVMRKAFGGAYIVMNSRSLGADAVLAWPDAELAVMGAEGAADIIFRRQLEAEPERRDDLVDSYRREAMHVDLAARRGSVDEVIDPAHTRGAVTAILRSLRGARQPAFVHDNLPQ